MTKAATFAPADTRCHSSCTCVLGAGRRLAYNSHAMNDVLTIVLGGGRGTRLFPLTHHRSKPAVPIGGKYRIIDIPLSNCLHAGLRRIYVLTQFNSASLNRHIAQTYRMDNFSERLRRGPCGRADARGRAVVSGHGRRRPAGGAPLRRRRGRLLSDPRRRSRLPDGLRRVDRIAHRQAGRHHDRGPTGHPGRGDPDGHLPIRCRRTCRRLRREAERGTAGRMGFERASRFPGRFARRREALRRLDGHLRLLPGRPVRGAGAGSGRRLRPRDHPARARHTRGSTRSCTVGIGPTSARSRRSTT